MRWIGCHGREVSRTFSLVAAHRPKDVDNNHSTLHSLGLPGVLQAIEVPSGLPQTLRQKAAEVRQDAGPSKVRTLMSDVQKLGNSNRSLLNEVSCMLRHEPTNIDAESSFQTATLLDAEEQEDAQEPQAARPRSSQASAPLRQKEAQFRSLIDSAASSDEMVRQKWAQWSDWIERLAGTEASVSSCAHQG